MRLITFPYDRSAAVAYAHRWAYGRNPAYYDFQLIGGDCTNFASQCLFAGSGVMNYTPVTSWYYISANDRTASWTGVRYLYRFLTGNRTAGPFARETGPEEMQPGDICQLAINGPDFHHSPVVVAVGETPSPDNILVAAHSRDADYRPLSSYSFRKARFLHVEGVRTFAEDE